MLFAIKRESGVEDEYEAQHVSKRRLPDGGWELKFWQYHPSGRKTLVTLSTDEGTIYQMDNRRDTTNVYRPPAAAERKAS